MNKLSLLAAAALTVAPACFLSRNSSNEPLASERVRALQPGTTTAAQVAEALGAPTEVVQLGRRMAWRYDFTNAKTAGFTILIVTMVNEDRRADRAWLFFDENNVLQFAGSTFEAAHAEYAMPWQDIHD